MNITTIREKYPQYADLPDKQLVDALHDKFYNDIPIKQFYAKVGLIQTAPANENVTSLNSTKIIKEQNNKAIVSNSYTSAAQAIESTQAKLAIQKKVERSWIRPLTANKDLKCTVQVRLMSDGTVISAEVISSSGDEIFDRSVENAVEKSSPLPVPNDKELFAEEFRTFQFLFNPSTSIAKTTQRENKDTVSSNQGPLSKEDAAWLAAYDKQNPPIAKTTQRENISKHLEVSSTKSSFSENDQVTGGLTYIASSVIFGLVVFYVLTKGLKGKEKDSATNLGRLYDRNTTMLYLWIWERMGVCNSIIFGIGVWQAFNKVDSAKYFIWVAMILGFAIQWINSDIEDKARYKEREIEEYKRLALEKIKNKEEAIIREKRQAEKERQSKELIEWKITHPNLGFVYILKNEMANGHLKIGFTDRESTTQRIKEINSGTGVIGKWQLVKNWHVDNARDCESILHNHKELKGIRTQKDREFFEINEEEAVVIVQEIMDKRGYYIGRKYWKDGEYREI